MYFSESDYLTSKLAQLQAAGKTQFTTTAQVKAAIVAAGFTTQQHFEQFGSAEGTSPNAYFNANEYLAAKAAQVNAKNGVTTNTAASVKAAIEAAGMSVYQHFEQFGWAEGVNPSNSFDVSSYLATKAAQSGKTVDQVTAAFKAAGFSPISHYMTHGVNETGVTVTAVPAAEQVASSPVQVTGQTFTLTTGTDTLIGTSGNDAITGTVKATGSTYTAVDTIVDNTSTDNDTLTLATTANLANSGVVSGVENVVINHTSFTNGTFNLDKVNATKVTVNNLQAAGADGATINSLASGSTVTAGTGVTGILTVSGRDGVTAITVASGESGTLNVGKVADTTAAAVAYNITSTATGTAATPVNINLEGSAATAADVATISAKGRVALATNTDGTGTDQVETLNLSGNTVAATYVIGNGAPTTMNITGSQDVTLEGIAAKFSGKTVSDSSTAVSKIKVVTTAAALDLTKVAVDTVEVAVDQAGNAITVDSGESLQVSLGQTSLTVTSAAATKATNTVSIDANDGAATVGTIAFGNAAFTNIATANINATDNVTIANTSSFTADGTIKVTGSGTVTVGATTGTITAKAVDASAATGVLTAFMGATFTTATGGSAKDVFNVEGDTNFTIDGGTALDTVKFGVSSLAADLNLADNTTTSLANIEVIEFVHDTNARTLTLDGSLLNSKAIVVKGTHASDVLAVSMDATSVDLSNINLGTNISKATINGSAIGTSALTITGTAMIDDVTAGAQSDTINLGEGNNIVTDAGDGDDTINAGAGNDTVTQAGAGNDTMNLGDGNNIVTDAGAGNDTITTGKGDDTVTTAGSGNDTMTLGDGTNTAYGDSGDDVITGGTGVDTFSGGADKDTLTGGAGADILAGDNGGTKAARTFTVAGTPETETLTFTAFGKSVTASALSTNTADQNAGLVKTAIETAFSDYLTVSAVSSGAITVTSKVDGAITAFTLTESGATANVTQAAATTGTLSSGGADTINADAGADKVIGGEGADAINLGAADGDADIVSIVFAATAGGDTITNFEAGTGNDVIKFANDQLVNGTPSATLSSITSTGTIGLNDVFVEVTTAAAAGAVDTAAEVATFLANVGMANVATNDKLVLALNDGADTYLWYYEEAGTTGAASTELKLIAKIVGVTDIADGDLAFFA